MAKLVFYVAITACLVASSKQQQSRERQLEAFKIMQSVEKQVQLARALSDRVESLLTKARSELDDVNINIKASKESTLNATLQPYADAILEALLIVNAANNSAAKVCVTKARTSINQQVINAVAKDVLECEIKIRNKLSDYIVKVTSQDSSKGTPVFDALFECQYSFHIESAADFEDARICYTQANNTLKEYIKQKMAEVDDAYFAFFGLQIKTKDCLSRGMAELERQGQAAVGAMVVCGKAAGVWLTAPNVTTAVISSVVSLEKFISEARQFIQPFYTSVKNITNNFNRLNSTLESEYVIAMQNTLDNIVYVEDFLKDSTNPEEVKCVTVARALYDAVIKQEIYLARRCLKNLTASLPDATLIVIDNNLQALLYKAVAEAVLRCTSKLPLTTESVNKCFNNELYQLQENVGAVLKEADVVVKNAEKLYPGGQNCFDLHAKRLVTFGSAVLQDLAKCLLDFKIELTFE